MTLSMRQRCVATDQCLCSSAGAHVVPQPPTPPAQPDAHLEPLPYRREPYTANAATCAKCELSYREDLSPLCLCDFCPRAYHLACLELVGTLRLVLLAVVANAPRPML